MTKKEQDRKRNRGNFIAIAIILPIFWLGCLWLSYLRFSNQKGEETFKTYGIKNIVGIDTIEINNFKHEFLTIRIKERNWGRDFHDSIIHSPKCECQPFYIKYQNYEYK